MGDYSTFEILIQCSTTVTGENNVELKRPFLESVFVFLCLLAVCLVYCPFVRQLQDTSSVISSRFHSSWLLVCAVSSGLDAHS